MTGSLFSASWYRVAELHPQLRPDVRVLRHTYRGQTWHLLVGAASGRQLRLNGQAYQFLGRCDGRRSVQQIWDALLAALGDDAPTQDEIIAVLEQLDAQGLLSYEVVPHATAIASSAMAIGQRKRQAFVNPFAFRIPLGNPAALLRRLEPFGAVLLNPLAFWIWLVVVAAAIVAAAAHWPELLAQATAQMSSPRFLLIALLCYPPIKLLHELGHALAVQRWGGEVREAGFSLLVLIPAPYVDASASVAFRERRRRVAVAAMGIMVELAVAAVALGVWLNAQPGLVREVAWVVAFLASVSTLLFNGNPLLSFDGYYILCELADMPNLGPRSRGYWRTGILRLAAGEASAPPASPVPGERKWLLLYAPLALVYRLAVSALIVLWMAGHSLVMAAAAAAYLVYLLLLRPAGLFIRDLSGAIPSQARRWRVAALAAAMAGGIAALALALPLPYYTVAPGIVWLPEQAHVRTGTDGFIRRLAARDGEPVVAGQLLVEMEDPALIAQRTGLESRLEALLSRQSAVLLTDTGQATRIEEEIAALRVALRRTEQRLASLTLRAHASGSLVMPRQQDLPGLFVRQGTTLGYVFDRDSIVVRAAVPEYDALLIRRSAGPVEVRSADAPGALRAQLVRDMPAAVRELPSAALGDRGGGRYATDPLDRTGLSLLEPVVLIDLRLPDRHLERVGTRAWVRFDHGAEPLARRWHRRLRQTFLEHLG